MSAVSRDPLRVLLVAARSAPYIGGVETHVHEVAPRLAQAGLDVTVLSTDTTRQLPATERVGKVQVLRVPAWPADRDYFLAPDVYRVITAGRWDVIHCQGYHSFVPPIAMLAARRTRTPYVLTFHSAGHSSHLRNSLRGVQWMLLRPLLARARHLIAVSRFEAEFFQQRLRLPRERFSIIPNGSNLPVVSTPAPASDGTGRPLIASIGRLERYKGHHRVIAALPQVLREYPGARLHIVGSGPYEPQLRRLADNLGVAQHVTIRALSPGDRLGMAKLLARAQLVTLLSEYESQGLAALEAVAVGRPVLVTATSGLLELAERQLVRAIPQHSNAHQVAAAMLEQLRRPAAPKPPSLPTWDACAAALLDVYRATARSCACAS
ncbi:MAG: glycosyltransferase family 4 protein [Chloroflexota bacterium]|nr:glycosyltransferase family 4 protein [Chloroflexota bacterium]